MSGYLLPWDQAPIAITLAVFCLTYLGVALGAIPGLALDRTGFALLGAIAMVALSAISLPDALRSIDAPTLLLLFALMILSAQFRLGGFYTWTVLRLSARIRRPRIFLALVMGVAALFSAFLVNDVVCLAFTPILAVTLLRTGMNPLPFLIGMAVASNIGSAATIIGNPQNMLIGQVGGLDFGRFLRWCAPPTLLALVSAYGLILFLFRKKWTGAPAQVDSSAAEPPFNRYQSAKGGLALLLLILFFFTPIPRELTALTLAGIILCSRRMRTRDLLGFVDWHLIILFCGLFIVIAALERTGLPLAAAQSLQNHGWPITQPGLLTVLSAALSNLVSNVPAVMLYVRFLDPSQPVQWYTLALASTFAGNLITLGSIANLITLEQARQYGIRIRFRDHARVGIPVTLISLAITLLWAWLGPEG
jgi:Na+/H+ antiporter NhaD/arsenite permease-like protein